MTRGIYALLLNSGFEGGLSWTATTMGKQAQGCSRVAVFPGGLRKYFSARSVSIAPADDLCALLSPSHSAVQDQGYTMAKSQLRSSREPKKPKKEKAKAAPSSSLWNTLERESKGGPSKKR